MYEQIFRRVGGFHRYRAVAVGIFDKLGRRGGKRNRNAGSGQPPKLRQRTVMIDGNREKIVMDGGRWSIIDLDKGTMQVIDPAEKSYFEMPFPFPGPGVRGLEIALLSMPASQFAGTGSTRTIAGAQCENYQGAGEFGTNEFTIVSCVSTEAPGAVEFSKFQKTMMAMLKEKVKQVATTANMPDGLPLAQEITVKVSAMDTPNLPPEAAERLKEQANRPPIVIKTEVTKVAEQKIEASEFKIPSGYTRRDSAIGNP